MNFFPPHLVQRIERPNESGQAEGPFTLSGLSPQANKVLGKFLSFDFMGSAEFEMNAIPKCLEEMIEIRHKFKAVSGHCTVQAPKLWGGEREAARKLGWQEPMPDLDVPFWLLVHKAIQTEMFVWICDVQAKQEHPRPSLKKNDLLHFFSLRQYLASEPKKRRK